MHTAIFRPKDAAAYLGVAVSTLYRWANEPGFPTRIKLGKHASGWRKADLDAWIDRQAKGERVA